MDGLISWQITYITNLVLAKILILMWFNLTWTLRLTVYSSNLILHQIFPLYGIKFYLTFILPLHIWPAAQICNYHTNGLNDTSEISKDKLFTCLKSLNYLNQWNSAIHFSMGHFRIINNLVSFCDTYRKYVFTVTFR